MLDRGRDRVDSQKGCIAEYRAASGNESLPALTCPLASTRPHTGMEKQTPAVPTHDDGERDQKGMKQVYRPTAIAAPVSVVVHGRHMSPAVPPRPGGEDEKEDGIGPGSDE